jgi:hypothetical protein
MRKGPNVHRADGFYKFFTLSGLALAVCAAGLTVWNVQRAQDRAFGLESEVAAVTAQVESQQAEVANIQKYLGTMTAKVQSATDVGTGHYNFMVDEVGKATRRVELGVLSLKGTASVATTKSSQIATLNAQRAKDIRIGGIVAGAGLVITFVGLGLWFWRVQRYVEIETQARMTTHLVEQIVARSRSEAFQAQRAVATEEMAVVSRRSRDIAAPPHQALPTG